MRATSSGGANSGGSVMAKVSAAASTPPSTAAQAIVQPLAVLTIALGVYPNPVFDIVGPSFERIMDPFLRGPLGG